MRVLVIGSGGREDAICYKLIKDGHEVIAAPGNPGMHRRGARCFPVKATDVKGLLRLAIEENVGETIVGPEAPLALGIVDQFRNAEKNIIGLTKAAANLEISKSLCYTLLSSNDIPIPHAEIYDDFESMAKALDEASLPVVAKYGGLAAGKGVVVVRTKEEIPAAKTHLRQVAEEGRKLGNFDQTFMLQECEEGYEVGVFVAADGRTSRLIGTTADYKPLYKGSNLNTGGLGGYSPHPWVTEEMLQDWKVRIFDATIEAARELGIEIRGVVYFQLMVPKKGATVIEINARFGDPEAEMLMVRMESPLLPLLQATRQDGVLANVPLVMSQKKAVVLVAASRGYPGTPEVGYPLSGLDVPDADNCVLFHAGTKSAEDGTVVTSGGRVYAVVGLEDSYREAAATAYDRSSQVTFEGMYTRPDIAEEVFEPVPV